MDEDFGNPPVGVELHHLELEPTHAAPEVHGYRADAGEDGEQFELQIRRGGEPFGEVRAERGLASNRPCWIAQEPGHQQGLELNRLGVVGKNPLEVVSVERLDPFLGNGLRLGFRH